MKSNGPPRPGADGRFDQPFKRQRPIEQTIPGGHQLRPIPDPDLPTQPPRHALSEPPAAPVDVVFDEEPDTGIKSARALADRHGELVAKNAELQEKLADAQRREQAALGARDALDRRELVDYDKTVRVQAGGFRVGIPAAVVLGIAGVIATAYYKHRDDPEPAADCVKRFEYATDLKLLNQRLAPLETFYLLKLNGQQAPLPAQAPAPATSRAPGAP